jgi:predicted amidohydrolase YtcJ
LTPQLQIVFPQWSQLSRLDFRGQTYRIAWAMTGYASSFEQGKFADLIMIDSNPLTLAEREETANIKVLRTLAGSKVVCQAWGF